MNDISLAHRSLLVQQQLTNVVSGPSYYEPHTVSLWVLWGIKEKCISFLQ